MQSRTPSPATTTSSSNSTEDQDSESHHTVQVIPTDSRVDYQLVSKIHLDTLSRYLAVYRAKTPPDLRSPARSKLTRLTVHQFHELSSDVYEEIIRRQNETEVPFLPVRSHLPSKRNQALQKLAMLRTSRFLDLCGDVHFELSRRYPEFKQDSSASVTLLSVPSQPVEPHGRRARWLYVSNADTDDDSDEELYPLQALEVGRLNETVKDKGGLHLIKGNKDRVSGTTSIEASPANSKPGDGMQSFSQNVRERAPDNVKVVVARLAEVFGDVQKYRRLLSYRDLDAQRLLDTFQTLLDAPTLNATFRRNLLVASQRLSRTSSLYPACYNLVGVELMSEHPIAAGSFADIYQGRLLGRIVCLKVLRIYQTSHVDSFLKRFSAEAILWGQLSHPNLLSIYGLYRYMSRLCLVSPWMGHGDVNNFLRACPEANRTLLVLDVALGVAYLHENDIIHGDLKGANILVGDSGRACIADFGLSAVTDTNILHWTSHSSAASKGGSIRWQAPELFDIDNDEVVHNSKPSDVYAFSCVAYEILTGNIPFFELARDSAVMLRVKMGHQPSRPPSSSIAWGSWGLTEPLWSLMEACWSEDPDDRPSINDVVAQHALRKSVDDKTTKQEKTAPHTHLGHSVGARPDMASIDYLESLLNEMDTEVEAPISTS